jgi:hypothetical protein
MFRIVVCDLELCVVVAVNLTKVDQIFVEDYVFIYNYEIALVCRAFWARKTNSLC